MKARVKILVNGAAATLLTGAVAAGLIFTSTGALQTKNNDILAARELDETQEDMTREQESQSETDAELISTDRYQLGMLWEDELTTNKTTQETKDADETDAKDAQNGQASYSAASAKSPLADYFSDQALVDPDKVASYLNVRVQADESAEVVNTICGEDLVSVLEEDGDWTKISIDDVEGWVKSEYLLTGEDAAEYMQENGTLYARVTVPNMNIRLRPSTSADILDVAYVDDAYEVSMLEDGWVYCVYDGSMKGYFSSDCMAVSYSLGETWINTDIALTEKNAKLLGIAVNESSAENFAAASSKTKNAATDENATSEADNATTDAALSVLTPAQMAVQESTASGNDAQAQEAASVQTSAVQQDTLAVSDSSDNDAVASPESAQPSTEPEQPSSETVTLTGIEAFYTGSTKNEGDVVYSSEVYIVAAYSDGNFATITEGWSSNDIGMMLQAGENVITLSYGGFSSNIVLTVAAASSAQPTEPSNPETQPMETQPAETQPTETQPTETQPTETQPTETVPETTPSETTPTGNIRVSNVSLSSDLTQYTLNLCSQYGVDSSVIFSVMYHESHFNAGATSGKGAQGLMQIIPKYSADRMAKLGVTNLYDPASNILVGIDLLAEYYYTYGSWNQALTAYRTGSPSGDSSYAATILGSVGLFQTVYYE